MGTTPATTTRNGSRQQEPSDATVVAVWPPKYHHASPTGNTPQVRYTRIQGLAFVVSCVSLTGFFAGFGPFGAQEGVLLALYVEVFLLLWRWANELAHDECDLSGWLHHGAFLLAIALIEFNTQVGCWSVLRHVLADASSITLKCAFLCLAVETSVRHSHCGDAELALSNGSLVPGSAIALHSAVLFSKIPLCQGELALSARIVSCPLQFAAHMHMSM